MKTITISKEEYEELLYERKMLTALGMAGVDNWQGYEYAMEILQELEEDDTPEIVEVLEYYSPTVLEEISNE